jgi:hypothetical protein
LAATGYVFDGTTETWLTVESLATTVKPGDIGFFSVPHLITEPQVAGGDPYQSTVESLEFALVVTPGGGEPDGTYTFLVGVDVSEVEDEQAAGAPMNVAVVAPLGQQLMAQSIPVVFPSDQDVHGELTTVNTKLDTLHADEVVVAGKLDTLHADVDGIEGKLDVLHVDETALAGKLDTLHADVDEVETKLDTLHTDLNTTLGGKLDTLHADVDGVEGKLDTLHADETTIAGKLDTLHADVDGVEAALALVATEATLATKAEDIKFRQEAGNSHLNDISGKLPATIGQKTTAASMSVTFPSDADPLKMLVPSLALQDLRVFNATVADADPVDGSAWVTMPGAGYANTLELTLATTAGALSVGGTVPPSQVTLNVWTRLGAGGAIRRAYSATLPASWVTQAIALNPYLPIHIPINAPDVFVTVAFPDGAAPTLTGTVKGRMVVNAGVTAKDLPKDILTGALLARILGYDSVADALRNIPGLFESDFALTEPGVMNTTGLAFGTPAYAPSQDGKILLPHDSISFQYSLAAGGGGTIKTWWEVANADVWTLASDITLSAFDLKTKSTPLASPITSAVGGTLTGFVQFDNINATRIRQVVQPETANSGAAVINTRVKVRGS